jgi:hypothetical protein
MVLKNLLDSQLVLKIIGPSGELHEKIHQLLVGQVIDVDLKSGRAEVWDYWLFNRQIGIDGVSLTVDHFLHYLAQV